jgi:hypothetical protein
MGETILVLKQNVHFDNTARDKITVCSVTDPLITIMWQLFETKNTINDLTKNRFGQMNSKHFFSLRSQILLRQKHFLYINDNPKSETRNVLQFVLQN